MSILRIKWFTWTAVGIGAVLLLGVGAAVINAALPSRGSATEPGAAFQLNKGLELVGPYTLAVPEEVRTSLGISGGKTARIVEARPPTRSQAMTLPGSTMLDTSRLWRVRIRFSARVVEIAPKLDEDGSPALDEAASRAAGKTVYRELRTGDTVKKGQRLGTFESADVGNIKSNLVDALSLFKMDQNVLDRGEAAYVKGAISEVTLLTFRRNVEADQNAINRAAANLRAWDISEPDIQACYKEAEEIRKRGGKRNPDAEKLWSRVEIVAPEDGIIVERNVARHELVQDATTNLFQIARLDRLIVLANCPEDDLPTLQDLQPKDRKWNVRTVGAARDKGIDGPIDEIGVLIDPQQHTAVIKGHIDNPSGRIRAGQFVAATVQLPPPPGCVEVPVDAICEDGDTCVVFVQPDPTRHEYTMRRVDVTHRFDKTAFVRSEPVPEKTKEPAADEKEPAETAMPIQPLKPGERVLTTGVGELKAALLDLMSRPKKDGKEGKGK